MRHCFYKTDFFTGVELRSVAGSGDYAPHFHDNYTIGLLTDGGQIVRTGRRTETALAGSVQFHAPFQVHANQPVSTRGISFLHFEITESRLLEFLENRLPVFRPNHIPDFELFQSLKRAFDNLTTGDNLLAHDESLTSALTKLFPADESSRFQPELAPRLVARIKDFLHANYAQSFTLDALAELTGVSRVHISRTFKRHVGLAPHEYLVQLRVARAKAEIAKGMPLAEAAAASGFADQSHLTRHFKRVTHITPGAYANSGYKHSRR